MKIKPFAILAMTGLAAATIAYVAPAIADENDFNDQSLQTLADNGGQNQSSDMQNNNPIMQSDNTSSSTPTPSSDAASPDTATGDDDY